MNAMTEALRDYRNIWQVAIVQREAGIDKMMTRVAVLLLVCAAILALIVVPRGEMDAWRAARFVLGAAATWLALVWAMLLMPGSIMLNSAMNARLLPRQRRRLMQMATIGWLLVTAAITAVIGRFTLLPVIGLYVLAFGMLGIGHKQTMSIFLVASNWAWLSRTVFPPALVAAVASDTARIVLTLLLPLILIAALRWIYPAGGDAHIVRRHAQMKGLAQFDGRSPPNQAGAGIGARIHAFALRRDLRRARADPGRLLLHALGPAAHWSAWMSPVLLILAAGIGVRLLLTWQRAATDGYLDGFMEGFVRPGLGVLTLAILPMSARFRQFLARTRGEQSLLRLAPLPGGAALLNRHLAGRLLRDALCLWAVLTLAILLVSVFDAGIGMLPRELGLCCLAGQMAMMGLLGDFAGDGGWSWPLALRAALLAALQACVAAGLNWVSAVPTSLWLAAISLGVMTFQLRRSWRAMLAAPVAYPARRMG